MLQYEQTSVIASRKDLWITRHTKKDETPSDHIFGVAVICFYYIKFNYYT